MADPVIAASAAFGPDTNTFFVGSTATQCTSSAKSALQAYLVSNLSTFRQYLTWGNSGSVLSIGAPVQGTPSANTLGIPAGATETFTLPTNSWFIASSGTGFEVTPGQGV